MKTENDSSSPSILNLHIKVTELKFRTLQNVFSYATER